MSEYLMNRGVGLKHHKLSNALSVVSSHLAMSEEIAAKPRGASARAPRFRLKQKIAKDECIGPLCNSRAKEGQIRRKRQAGCEAMCLSCYRYRHGVTKSGSSKRPRGPATQGGPQVRDLEQVGKQKRFAGTYAIQPPGQKSLATCSDAAPVRPSVNPKTAQQPPAVPTHSQALAADPLGFNFQLSAPSDFHVIRDSIHEHFTEHCEPGVTVQMPWRADNTFIEGPVVLIFGAHDLVRRSRRNLIDLLYASSTWLFPEPLRSLLLIDQKERSFEKFVHDMSTIFGVAASITWTLPDGHSGYFSEFRGVARATSSDTSAKQRFEQACEKHASAIDAIDFLGDDRP